MIDAPMETTSTRPSRLRTLGLVVLGLVAGVGGTLLLRPNHGHAHEHEAASATAPKKQREAHRPRLRKKTGKHGCSIGRG